MVIKKAALFLIATSVCCSGYSIKGMGASFQTGVSELDAFRLSVPLQLVKQEKYGADVDLTSLSVLIVDGKPKIGLNPLIQFLLVLPAFGVPFDVMEKFQYPFLLTNFRLRGNITRWSFLYYRQSTDVFTEGIYSEGSAGLGFRIKKFELHAGGAKTMLDPFGMPSDITWRVGISQRGCST